MFFTECANLADRHPDLAGVIRNVDELLQDFGAAEVLRIDDFASYLGVDPNRVASVFEMLAECDVLIGEKMVECPYCKMAVRQSDFDYALEEEGEFRCTGCDRPLLQTSVQEIFTYRQGGKWKEGATLTDQSAGSAETISEPRLPVGMTVDDQAWYTQDRLAEVFYVGKEALRKRLDRYRKGSMDGWKENDDRRPREPKYLYQLCMVRGIIEAMPTSSERPAN